MLNRSNVTIFYHGCLIFAFSLANGESSTPLSKLDVSGALDSLLCTLYICTIKFCDFVEFHSCRLNKMDLLVYNF